ncbi:hypothetical protein [Porphyromonas sp. COT-239 OH1446]|uniref:hypothetical protein n=1 Tax=Porphyromonas sp. COT-239 OH1446 TaxID=1515613 RepID=UPI00052DA108|nr:hypothetical protein [Porphyromonas sp. COT-239 OH1446]KGN69931.1 hypothetical protein HQ37_05360 [Porphyromonas sp. COT-239 OH1446]
MNKVFIALVAIVAGLLAYLTYESVATPVRFDKVQIEREKELQKKLKKIANYQDAYEDVYDRFASREELTEFLTSGKLYYVKAEGVYTDEMREKGLSEQEAAQKGLIVRDTTWVSAKDSLLKDGTDVATLFNVLNTNNKISVVAAYIEQVAGQDTIQVPVFEATIPFEAYLADQDQKRLELKKAERKKKANSYAGLRIGSLKEVKMTGNWE